MDDRSTRELEAEALFARLRKNDEFYRPVPRAIGGWDFLRCRVQMRKSNGFDLWYKIVSEGDDDRRCTNVDNFIRHGCFSPDDWGIPGPPSSQ